MVRSTTYCPLILLLTLWGLDNRKADAQVVQLPTFHTFSVGTTVSIPDRGSALLGGVGRARTASQSAGMPLSSGLPWLDRLTRTRSLAAERSSSTASVTATVHDLRGPPVNADTSTDDLTGEEQSQVLRLTRHVLRAEQPAASVRAIRQQHAEADRRHAAEQAAHLARGGAAEAAGAWGAARCAYRIVVRRGTPAQQREASQRLATLAARLGEEQRN